MESGNRALYEYTYSPTRSKYNMKQIDDLMPLATLEDLRVFCQDYARKDKKFNKELTKFLNERFIEDEDSLCAGQGIDGLLSRVEEVNRRKRMEDLPRKTVERDQYAGMV